MKNIFLLTFLVLFLGQAQSQSITFEMVDVFSTGFNGVSKETTFDLRGSFTVSKEDSLIALEEDGITEKMKILGTQTTEEGGEVFFCEHGFSFVAFWDKGVVTCHKTYVNFEGKTRYVERRLYSLTKTYRI
jgi:hypothetical protein